MTCMTSGTKPRTTSKSVDARFDGIAPDSTKWNPLRAASTPGSNKVDARLNGIDTRLDKMDARLDKMDVRFDKLDTRLDKMDVRFDKMDVRFNGIDGGSMGWRACW